MKKSRFLVVGFLISIGVMALGIYKSFFVKKDNHQEDTFCSNDESCSFELDDFSTDFYATPVTDVNETKEAVVSSIKERHEEASKVMEEALNTIFKENDDEIIITENSDTLNQMSNTLKDLLK